MAGAGFYDFTAGEVLTADAVDTYLMQQSIMVFASDAARTTALGTVVSEGMASYLLDTGSFEIYNGATWQAVGGGGGGGGFETNFLLMGA